MLPDLTARPRWYVLDGHTPTPAASHVEWAQWFNAHTDDVRVAVTVVGHLSITTRFTGIDGALDERAAPLLFETLITDGKNAALLGDWSSWDEAEHRHAAAVKSLENEFGNKPAVNQARPATTLLALCRAALRRAVSFSSASKKDDTTWQSDI